MFRKYCDVVRVAKEPYVAAVYLVPLSARLLSVCEGEVDDGDPEDGRQRVALWSAALQRELGC